MIIRPRATSLRINSGSSFSRFATYCISSVTTPCRAKCICETFRLPFACPDTGRAPAMPASLFSIQLSRNAINPPQTRRRVFVTFDASFESRIRTTRWNYGTRRWVPQLATHSKKRARRMLKIALDTWRNKSENLGAHPLLGPGALYGCRTLASGSKPRKRAFLRRRHPPLRSIAPLLGLRILPPGTGSHRPLPRRRSRRLRHHAYRRRQIALLPTSRRARRPHRRRDLPAHRPDAGPGRATPPDGHFRRLPECRHPP